MPQHVRMDSERHHLGGRHKPRHHPAKGNGRHRSAALAHEDISSGFLLALEAAQGAKFDAGQWMEAREVRSIRWRTRHWKRPRKSPKFLSSCAVGCRGRRRNRRAKPNFILKGRAMGKEYKSGDTVEHSGVYLVL